MGEYIPLVHEIRVIGFNRLILNLKSLNENIGYIHFKAHGLKEFLKMVEKNYFIASLDIKGAYKDSFQKYLANELDGF